MKRSWSVIATLMIAIALPLRAALPPIQDGDTATISARRSMVTRTELQAAIDEIQRGLTSSAYSASLRSAKQKEAAAIKLRLDEGDLRSGDEVTVTVLAEPGLSAVYTVTPMRTIVLPGGFEVPVRGILRTEVQPYLSKQLTRYITEPIVTASASIRVSIFGAVGNPGFYNIPADMRLSTALQTVAKGLAATADLKKSQVLRAENVVIDGREFNEDLYQGLTLDQMNIQAGDVIQIAAKPPTGKFLTIASALSGMAGLILLITRVW